jgi:8-oxo-dGTP pyrophosphatase MutT (NUDIX family)
MNSPIIQSRIRQEVDVSATVQVDLGNMDGAMGRIKAPPVCAHAALKQQAMSSEELAKLSFPLKMPIPLKLPIRKNSICTDVEHEPSVVSSSSSTASRESALSDLESKQILTTPLRLERQQSSQINLKVTNQKISRSGRETQRWYTDPSSQRIYRMVTGCVPIVEGGRVLFVSASRKPEWILPKGGWEKDEPIEESAIRECFEEAGVLGVLGPRLNEFDYETRKAKKRRLEFEEHQRKSKLRISPATAPRDSEDRQDHQEATEKPKAEAVHISPSEESITIRTPLTTSKMPQMDETSSVASDSSVSHTHIRLSLFVLYVSEVKSTWPESGRSRKVVDIDEAIKMCESRPEFLAALKEVKERNLHHLPEHEKEKQVIEER